MSKNKISISLVGLGKISTGSDLNKTKNPISHLGVLMKKLNKYQICFLADSKVSIFKKIKLKWPHIPKKTFSNQILPVKCDVVVIATPSSVRLDVIKKSINLNQPKLIIIEKPLALSLREATKIAHLLNRHKVNAIVNFHRRYEKSHVNFFTKLPETPQKIVVRYSKGLFNYASHMLDLILFYYGKVSEVQSFGIKVNHKLINDSNYSFALKLKNNIEVIFLGMNNLNYDQLEMQLFCGKNVYSIENAGTEMYIRTSVPNLYYKGYNQLGVSKKLKKQKKLIAFNDLYDNVANYILKGKKLAGCTIVDAIYNIKVLEAVMLSEKTGKKVILK